MNVNGLAKISDLNKILNRPITSQDISLLALAPSTRLNYQHTLADYIKSTASIKPPLPLWSPERIKKYISIVVNRTGVSKASGVLTKLHNLTAIAALSGHHVTNLPEVHFLSKGLKKLQSFQMLKQAEPMPFPVLKQVVETCLQQKLLEYAAMFSLMWLLAMRVEDALRLPRNQVQVLEDSILILPRWHKTQAHTQPKTSLALDLPFSKVILAHLIQSHGSLVFPMKSESVDKLVKNLAGNC